MWGGVPDPGTCSHLEVVLQKATGFPILSPGGSWVALKRSPGKPDGLGV